MAEGRPLFWRLVGHDVEPLGPGIDGVHDWSVDMEARCMEVAVGEPDPWAVAKTVLEGADVSTVFLGLDHEWRQEGPPLIFETMVFGDVEFECEPFRSSTWDAALATHDQVVARTRAAIS